MPRPSRKLHDCCCLQRDLRRLWMDANCLIDKRPNREYGGYDPRSVAPSWIDETGLRGAVVVSPMRWWF